MPPPLASKREREGGGGIKATANYVDLKECDKARMTKLMSVLSRRVGKFQVLAKLPLLTEKDAHSVMELMMQPSF